jgi:putative transposase
MKKEIIRFVPWVGERGKRPRRRICKDLGLSWSRYQRWRRLAVDGRSLVDGHGGGQQLDSPLPEERQAVIDHALAHPKDGYRRLAWQMIDQDVAYLSESAVYRILDSENLLCRWALPNRKGGDAPPRPTAPHQRWHTDIMHLRLGDTWYFLVSFIDAYSRFLLHWRLLPNMCAEAVTLAQLEALEKYPGARPEIVSDRGSQYTSREFRKLIERFELKHILCRVAHPQSNGIIERYHRSTRGPLREELPENYLAALDVITIWGNDYNEHRLHAALRHIEPAEYFRGDPERRMNERRAKLERARLQRRQANQTWKGSDPETISTTKLPTADGSSPTSMETHSRRAAVHG